MKRNAKETLQKIFNYPVSGQISWKELLSLFNSLGADIKVYDASSKFKVRLRSGFMRVLDKPIDHLIDSKQEYLSLQKFFKDAGILPEHTSKRNTLNSLKDKPDKLGVVYIDHHECKIYDNNPDAEAKSEIVPYDPDGFRWHLQLRYNNSWRGNRVPVFYDFFRDIAPNLAGYEKILIMGHGKGHSDIKNDFVKFLKKKHKKIADRIIGVLAVSNLTERQLLSEANAFIGIVSEPIMVQHSL